MLRRLCLSALYPLYLRVCSRWMLWHGLRRQRRCDPREITIPIWALGSLSVWDKDVRLFLVLGIFSPGPDIWSCINWVSFCFFVFFFFFFLTNIYRGFYSWWKNMKQKYVELFLKSYLLQEPFTDLAVDWFQKPPLHQWLCVNCFGECAHWPVLSTVSNEIKNRFGKLIIIFWPYSRLCSVAQWNRVGSPSLWRLVQQSGVS